MPASGTPQARPNVGAALLIIDMISTWDFPDADKLLPPAQALGPRLAALKARCRSAGWAIVYANDNQGRWRSDFRQLVDLSSDPRAPGAELTRLLRPHEDDYFVLKPKHSAFFCTPLELLLQRLKVRRLVLTGVASDQCIVSTAMDARMREYEVCVPRDGVATQSEVRNARAVQHLAEALKVDTAALSELQWLTPSNPPQQ
ncbi:MAG: isochorismatase family cysteine hydrolase [Pseudomonadota bacterium]